METRGQWTSVDAVVEEIMRIHRGLPSRPGIEEVEAAKSLIQNVDKEEHSRLESISRQTKSPDVPQELFMLLTEMQKSLVHFHAREEKREALKLLDLDNAHSLFDAFIQRASRCLSPSSHLHHSNDSFSYYNNNNNASASASASAPASAPAPAPASNSTASPYEAAGPSSIPPSSSQEEKQPPVVGVKTREVVYARDDSYLSKSKSSLYSSNGISFRGAAAAAASFSTPSATFDSTASGQDGDKLSLIKLASLIEVSAKKGTRDLNLQNKLMDQIEWLPDSIGKLSSLLTLDLSDNRISALPTTIRGLSSLTKLDLHSNRVAQLPESIGDLLNLVFLDVRANQLSSLPSTFSRLVRLQELDLSSNCLSALPDSIGSLISLRRLIVETNDIEELPHTIGQCSALKELRADYNRLKALPEAVGKIESLEILSVRYNNIKQLPTTMSSLIKLKELDVSFNELESVPESLCFATSLIKMNVGNNFADLRSLPRSIGNLESLEELDISNNQIHFLPDSFRMLTKLRALRVEENPLEVPPRHIAEKGAQAVVQYMAELVERRDVKPQPIKQKKSWTQMCFFSKSNKRKHSGTNYVKA